MCHLFSFAYYFVMIVVRGKYVYDGFLNTLTCRWWLAVFGELQFFEEYRCWCFCASKCIVSEEYEEG